MEMRPDFRGDFFGSMVDGDGKDFLWRLQSVDLALQQSRIHIMTLSARQPAAEEINPAFQVNELHFRFVRAQSSAICILQRGARDNRGFSGGEAFEYVG